MPQVVIERLLIAAELSGVYEALAIVRYCTGDAGVTLPPEFTAAYLEEVHSAGRG